MIKTYRRDFLKGKDDLNFQAKFDSKQMEAIRRGLRDGLTDEIDISSYADPKFNSEQMIAIREGLKEELDTSIYADPIFDSDQMWEIKEGLQRGLDVSIYANPIFDDEQMYQIREGLEDGLDVSIYADLTSNSEPMAENQLEEHEEVENLTIREKEKALLSYIQSGLYDEDQLAQIRDGLFSNIDVRKFANPSFGAKQMEEIKELLLDEEIQELENKMEETFDEFGRSLGKSEVEMMALGKESILKGTYSSDFKEQYQEKLETIDFSKKETHEYFQFHFIPLRQLTQKERTMSPSEMNQYVSLDSFHKFGSSEDFYRAVDSSEDLFYNIETGNVYVPASKGLMVYHLSHEETLSLLDDQDEEKKEKETAIERKLQYEKEREDEEDVEI